MKPILICLIALLLVGCTDGSGSSTATVQNDFDGDQREGQSEANAGCDDQVEIHYDLSRLAGDLTIMARDGEGSVRFVREFRDETGEMEHSLLGAPGTWTLLVGWDATSAAFEATIRCASA